MLAPVGWTLFAVAGIAHHNGPDTNSLVMMLAPDAGIMLAALVGGATLDQCRAALVKDIS